MRNKMAPGNYTGIVISGKVDKDKRGAVQCIIQGVTDDWAEENQPYVYPAPGIGLQQVPQTGFYLLVRFKDNDINQGYYYGISSTPKLLPSEYVSEYPDVAVANLGEDDYTYTHNRKTHVSFINNPGNFTTVEWNAEGYVTLECKNAHDSAGIGGNVQNVLTEATIDIFTCMPVGHNRDTSGIGQGSEYLAVSHIAQKTIDAFRGNATPEAPAELKPKDDSDDNGTEVRDIFNSSGSKNGSIEFHEGTFVKVNGERVYKHIILCHSQGENYPKQANKIMTTNSSVHFLIGEKDGVPEVLTELPTGKLPENTGAAQFIELENDGGMFAGSKYKGDKASTGAIIIMVIGNVLKNYTDYQSEMVNKLIEHIRYKSGNSMLPVITPDDFDKKNVAASMVSYSPKG